MSLAVSPTAVQYYDVSGATLSEAADNAVLDGGESGRCDYEVWYEYNGVSSRGLPRNLVLHLELTILMPRWVDKDEATQPEIEEWDRFYAALLEHERGHASRLRAGARVVHARLARTRVADIEARFQSGKRTMHRDNIAYDDATDHGRRPPPGTVITIP